MRHFASTRLLEVVVLQASPFLGCMLGGFSLEWPDLIRMGLLLCGSLALTVHVFVFNDWAGQVSDRLDPRRAGLVFTERGISARQVACVATSCLLIANGLFAWIGGPAILFGNAIAALSILYSCSQNFGKSTPVVASLNHLAGGTLHFLLGYTLFHGLDSRGVAIGLFFGLVFAGGHLNQEVRDYEGDLLSGIRTSAVAYGRRAAFLASLFTFTTAYALVVFLAASSLLPGLLLASVLLWLIHALWSIQALKRGLGFETALWMQRRYRLLFAVIGLAMLT